MATPNFNKEQVDGIIRNGRTLGYAWSKIVNELNAQGYTTAMGNSWNYVRLQAYTKYQRSQSRKGKVGRPRKVMITTDTQTAYNTSDFIRELVTSNLSAKAKLFALEHTVN